MITFSTSAMKLASSLRSRFTLYSSAPALPASRLSGRGVGDRRSGPLLAPPRDGPSQMQVGDRARRVRRQEGKVAVAQHGDDGHPAADAEPDERSDHPAVDPADPTGQR